MKYGLNEIVIALLKTLFLLILLEVFVSAFLPAIGLENVELAFNVLVVLYLAFKVETPLLAFLILIVQYTHSAFSIEGWAAGTIVGLIVVLSVKYLRNLLQFGSALSTIIVVQVSQVVWFGLLAFILSIKLGSFDYYLSLFGKFIPESFLLSLMSPFFFVLLDQFWKVREKHSGVIS